MGLIPWWPSRTRPCFPAIEPPSKRAAGDLTDQKDPQEISSPLPPPSLPPTRFLLSPPSSVRFLYFASGKSQAGAPCIPSSRRSPLATPPPALSRRQAPLDRTETWYLIARPARVSKRETCARADGRTGGGGRSRGAHGTRPVADAAGGEGSRGTAREGRGGSSGSDGRFRKGDESIATQSANYEDIATERRTRTRIEPERRTSCSTKSPDEAPPPGKASSSSLGATDGAREESP